MHGAAKDIGRVRTIHRQAQRGEIRLQAGGEAILRHPQFLRQLRRQDDAYGDRLPVGDVVSPQPGLVLDRVREGVPQVQFHPLPLLVRVPRHDIGLDPFRPPDMLRPHRQRFGLPSAFRGFFALGGRCFGLPKCILGRFCTWQQRGVAFCIGQKKGFHQFRQAGAEFPRRKGGQHLRAEESELRLHDHAQHILVPVQVYAGFSADRGIYLREQRGGHVGIADAPLVDAGGKSGQIGGDSTAHGQHQRPPGSAFFQQAPLQGKHCFHGLSRLGCFQADSRPHRNPAHNLIRDPGDILVEDDVDFLFTGQQPGYTGKGIRPHNPALDFPVPTDIQFFCHRLQI